MTWAAISAMLAIVAGLAYFWFRRRTGFRLVSIVGLLREPDSLDPATVARIAGKAWGADLGDGASEGTEGFVAGEGATILILHGGRRFLVHRIPKPYMEDVEEATKGIVDLRIRTLFREHRAWFSCDALDLDGRSSAEEVRDAYRRLGRLFAEFLGENCLLLYLPDSGFAYPINEDTEAALRSEDPAATLQKTVTLPMVEISGDDPLLQEAVKKAREGWPRFVAAFEKKEGGDFSVKAPVSRDGHTEFIWIEVASLEGDRVFGALANDPVDLGTLKAGSSVAVPVLELNDWAYVDSQGNLVGGFTIDVVRKSACGKRKRR